MASLEEIADEYTGMPVYSNTDNVFGHVVSVYEKSDNSIVALLNIGLGKEVEVDANEIVHAGDLPCEMNSTGV